MKHLLASLCFIGLLAACNSRPTTEATNTDSASTDSARADKVPTKIPTPFTRTPTLDGLGLTTNYDWRRVNIGDDFTSAKSTETAAPFEQDVAHAGYSQEFSNLESVDYQYFQAENKVERIQVDFYLNSLSAVKTYRQELTTYLTARYGPANAGTFWKNGNVVLKDVSKGKDFGLKLEIK